MKKFITRIIDVIEAFSIKIDVPMLGPLLIVELRYIHGIPIHIDDKARCKVGENLRWKRYISILRIIHVSYIR